VVRFPLALQHGPLLLGYGRIDAGSRVSPGSYLLTMLAGFFGSSSEHTIST